MNHVFGWNRDGIAGSGVSALAGIAEPCRERSKPAQFDTATSLKGLGDFFKDMPHNPVSFFSCQVGEFFRDLDDEL
jgi:hypothetical protein